MAEVFELSGKTMIRREIIYRTKKDAEVELAKPVTKEQKSIYGELWTDSGRLFVQADSKPMPSSTIIK